MLKAGDVTTRCSCDVVFEAARRYVNYPLTYNGGTKLTKYGYSRSAVFGPPLRRACFSAELGGVISPYDFRTEHARRTTKCGLS